MRRNQGTTLIFVLGILALLSLFAISFASVTRVERVASANYVDGVRANLAARAGIAAGIAGAHEEFRVPCPSNASLGGYLDPYHFILNASGSTITLGSVVGINAGDKLTLGGGTPAEQTVTVSSVDPTTGDVVLSSTPAAGHVYAVTRGANWFYHGHSLNPATTGNGIPIALSLTMGTGTGTGSGFGVPSLALPVGPTLTTTSTIFRCSGSTGGTYFADPSTAGVVCGGDIYAVKILDAQGMLDANMEPTDLQAILPSFGADVIAELTQISGAIKASVSPLDVNNFIPLLDSNKVAYKNPFDTSAYPNNAANFIAYRNGLSGQRFRSKEQLKGAFYAIAPDPATAEAWFTMFRDYFSCYSDYDGNATLNEDSANTAWNPPGGIPLLGSGTPDVSKIFQNNKTAIPRSLVDVNTAPLPVLTAVLSTIHGRLMPTPVTDSAAGAVSGLQNVPSGLTPMAPYGSSGNGVTATVARADAQNIAMALVKARPFRSWNEIYRLFDAIHQGGPILGALGISPVPDNSLILSLAAVCPVDLPLSLNPDRSLLYWDPVNPDDVDASGKPLHLAVTAEKAGTHACADFGFTSGYFEVEALGRVYANPTQPFIVAEAYKRCVVNVGGVTWVRGERDLASQLPPSSNFMGAPGLVPDSSYVGGWVQPKPADSGLVIPPGAAVTADTGQVGGGGVVVAQGSNNLGGWTPNAADGFLMARSQWETLPSPQPDVLVVHGTNPSDTDAGQAEMWVKQPFDVSQGTNEALFMNVRQYPSGLRHAEYGAFSTGNGSDIVGSNGSQSVGGGDASNIVITQIGVATRLERFGNKLYACRFFWGYPDGASAPTPGEYMANGLIASLGNNPLLGYASSMHAYLTSQPLDWKAGTWHHVFLSWDVLQLTLYVDGVLVGTAVPDATFQGGAIWEKTVNGFFPDKGTGGIDPSNQFAKEPRDGSADQAIQQQVNQAQADMAAAQADIAAKNQDIQNMNNAIAQLQAQNASLATAAASSTPSISQPAQNQINSNNAQIQNDQNNIQNDNNAIAADNAKIAAAQKLIKDAQQFFAGGSGNGNFATDVKGDTFTAELGLRRMKLRTHLPAMGVVDGSIQDGVTESYFMGYRTPDPYLGEAPPQIVTINFTFGPAGNSNYFRYCNGTFDALKWNMTAQLGGPSVTPHRYNVDSSASNGTYQLALSLPVGCIAVANGFHVIAAHGVFPQVDDNLMGGGSGMAGSQTGSPAQTTQTFTTSGQTVTVQKIFPVGSSTCNVKCHHDGTLSPACSLPGSDEVPFAIAGAWIAYEKPTTFLETEEVD